ncbi:hypothetical protein ACFPTR_02930 [Aliibacillus thermotolerans]|uniref:Copper amine oxidase-like N-terminal domain-containing protein n=1 Tax=Aliibacillus thermotolerans TaxID=1834418 RepID=A0ABW0U4F4_9BACI|nr:hypothetical protein [Aliibacillus thermotolerans]MDA3129188.1 hypothetical protein [Aliibacillus thermotolerans]
MKKIFGSVAVIFIFFLLQTPSFGATSVDDEIEVKQFSSEERETTEHVIYIDGQEQKYPGEPIFHGGNLYVPVSVAIAAFHEKMKTDVDLAEKISLSTYDYFAEKGYIEQINQREVVRVKYLQNEGIRAEWLDQPGRLHLETTELLTVHGISVGDTLQQVNERFDVHWNTGYGQPADYIGFYGEMNEYTYTDRFGKTRAGEVPELQFEIIDNRLTYIFVSDSDYEISKGIRVGDSLYDTVRQYGADFVRAEVDGKNIYIYHVKGGSIWFIAEGQEIERIALWQGQLEGYER